MKQLRARLFSLLSWSRRFLRENPGALFIVGFQALLVACAAMLVLGIAAFAEGVAVGAYFLLVVGVVLQLVWFVRRDRHGG
jgi:hypothetical protein